MFVLWFSSREEKNKPSTAATSGEGSTSSALHNIENFNVKVVQNHPYTPVYEHKNFSIVGCK